MSMRLQMVLQDTIKDIISDLLEEDDTLVSKEQLEEVVQKELEGFTVDAGEVVNLQPTIDKRVIELILQPEFKKILEDISRNMINQVITSILISVQTNIFNAIASASAPSIQVSQPPTKPPESYY